MLGNTTVTYVFQKDGTRELLGDVVSIYLFGKYLSSYTTALS